MSCKDLLTRKIRQSCFAQFSFSVFCPLHFLTTTSKSNRVEALLTLNFRSLSYPSLFTVTCPILSDISGFFEHLQLFSPIRTKDAFLALFSKLARRGRLTKQHLSFKGLRAYRIRTPSFGNIPILDNKGSEKNMEA